MRYVIKVADGYVYSIQLKNGLMGKNNTVADICSKKQDALRFKHKNLAQGFANILNGIVEKINIDLFVV